jgi:transcriptional regulator with XRE-family HTH domain
MNHALLMSIGIRIRQARRAAKLTQEKLGEHLGISKQMVSHIERGRHHVTVDHIIIICRACNTSADWLILGRGADTAVPDRILAVARRIVSMKPEQQELLLTMFSGIANHEHVSVFAGKSRE